MSSKKFPWSDKFASEKLSMNVPPEEQRKMAAKAAAKSAITTFEHWGHWLCEGEQEIIESAIEKVVLQFLEEKYSQSDRPEPPTDDEYLKGVSWEQLEKAFYPINEFNFRDAVIGMIKIYASKGDCQEFKILSEMIGIYLRII
ncbi:hypothetical protein [Fischerella sp. PCC 9605]|uniref:hypothetical protein n=1 Tax=Fischerella sp. PCC 9605 TaxID=1173024 RepID=UPI00047CA509|nr:hypothetical protein [Fischerella sp. PCC 9605]